jgi:transglutaminase-like putative cysteine protease
MNHTVRNSLLLFASVAALLGAAYVSQALSRPDPWKAPTKFEFEYRVDFSELDVKPDQQLRVWIPYPRENQDQRLGDASLDVPWPHQISTDARGNRMIHFEGRGIPSQPFVMRLVVERQPSAGIRVGEIDSDSFDAPDAYLKAAKLIPLGGIIGRLAEQQSKGHETDSAKVRAFYDYVVKNMRYNKDGSGWGRGDAIWACDNKRGNCTDFHSLFIGMARSEDIPARFVMGVPIPQAKDDGPIPGYHCWAQYYDAERGWVPVDASEAFKSGRADDYFGFLPSDRIEFTVGRDLTLAPAQAGPPLNYFIYPYAEVDGKPLKEVPFAFEFRRFDG